MQTYITDLDVATLRKFVCSKVTTYPISAGTIATLAQPNDKTVADFYKLFPADMMFASKEDLLERSEQVKLLEDGGAFQKRLPTYDEFDSY